MLCLEGGHHMAFNFGLFGYALVSHHISQKQGLLTTQFERMEFQKSTPLLSILNSRWASLY